MCYSNISPLYHYLPFFETSCISANFSRSQQNITQNKCFRGKNCASTKIYMSLSHFNITSQTPTFFKRLPRYANSEISANFSRSHQNITQNKCFRKKNCTSTKIYITINILMIPLKVPLFLKPFLCYSDMPTISAKFNRLPQNITQNKCFREKKRRRIHQNLHINWAALHYFFWNVFCFTATIEPFQPLWINQQNIIQNKCFRGKKNRRFHQNVIESF